MSYVDHFDVTGQPQPEWVRDREFGACLRKADTMPRMWVAAANISAVLWDPAEGRDEEGDMAYLLVLATDVLSVFSQKPPSEFIVWLLDPNNPKRDWLQRMPTQSLRTDFAVGAYCRHRLPFTTVTRCAVALVPSRVQAVVGHPTEHECGLLLGGLKVPLVVETGSQTVAEFCNWLYDGCCTQPAAQSTPSIEQTAGESSASGSISTLLPSESPILSEARQSEPLQ